MIKNTTKIQNKVIIAKPNCKNYTNGVYRRNLPLNQKVDFLFYGRTIRNDQYN